MGAHELDQARHVVGELRAADPQGREIAVGVGGVVEGRVDEVVDGRGWNPQQLVDPGHVLDRRLGDAERHRHAHDHPAGRLAHHGDRLVDRRRIRVGELVALAGGALRLRERRDGVDHEVARQVNAIVFWCLLSG